MDVGPPRPAVEPASRETIEAKGLESEFPRPKFGKPALTLAKKEANIFPIFTATLVAFVKRNPNFGFQSQHAVSLNRFP